MLSDDELRALAEALEPMAKAPRFADFDVPGFCAWVRACADAKPVAWLHDVVQDGDEPDQALSFYRDSFPLEGVGGFRSIGCVPLYPHPAPAAPQAMEDANVWKQIVPDDEPQAEPKREPACLWSRADDDTDTWETSCGHAFTIIEGTPTDNHMAFCCYCGRRVDEETGGSDE